MKPLPFALAALLVALPFEARAQSQDPEPQGTTLFQLVVGGIVVVVGASAVYAVYKTAQAANSFKCGGCGQIVPAKSFSCPSCGKAARCETCGAKLPPDSENCPRCFTKVPGPKKALTTIQVLAGTNWVTAATLNTNQCVFYDDLSIMGFASPAEFEAWCSEQADLVKIEELPAPARTGFFRLASE